MIIGSHSLNPKRILAASYSPASEDAYILKIGYQIGNELVEMSQIASKKDCSKYLRKIDKIINQHYVSDIVAESSTKSIAGFNINESLEEY